MSYILILVTATMCSISLIGAPLSYSQQQEKAQQQQKQHLQLCLIIEAAAKSAKVL
jgi:hypothetical protein